MELESIVRYLDNKTIFITGAAGFVVNGTNCSTSISLSLKSLETQYYAWLQCHDDKVAGLLLLLETSIREKQGAKFDSFISEKVVALSGDVQGKEELSNEIQIILNSAASIKTGERISNDLEFIPLDYMGYQYLFWSYQVEQRLLEKGCMYTIQEPRNVHDTEDQSEDRATAVDLMYWHLDPELQLEYGDITDPYTLYGTLQDRFVDMRDETISFWDNRWDKLRIDTCDDLHEYKSKLTHILQAMSAVGITITDNKLIEKTLSTFPVQAKAIATALKQKCEDGKITSHDMLLSEIDIHEILSCSCVPSDQESTTGTRKRKRVPKKPGKRKRVHEAHRLTLTSQAL